jgi:tetratricopeptide (TPR) repeat protein
MRPLRLLPDAGRFTWLAAIVLLGMGLALSLGPPRVWAGPGEHQVDMMQQPATLGGEPAGATAGSGLSPEQWGDLLMARRNYVAAIESYRQGPPETATQWNKIGVAYHHLFALDEAKKDYQKALSIDPKNADAMNNLGTVFHAQRNYRKAIHYYKRALKVERHSAPVYCNLGTAYFAQGKWGKGERAYEEAFALDPSVFDPSSGRWIEENGPARERAALHFALAKMYARAGKREMALMYLRKALDEGFKDRRKLMEDSELASLRGMPEFKQLAEEER